MTNITVSELEVQTPRTLKPAIGNDSDPVPFISPPHNLTSILMLSSHLKVDMFQEVSPPKFCGYDGGDGEGISNFGGKTSCKTSAWKT
jgi:hypothetical protein